MDIQVLGGDREIGGNKILVTHGDTRILLDFGMSFSKSSMYFSEFLQPRKCTSLKDFFEFDLLPDLSGVYREDYLKHMGRDPEERSINALFLSHAHADHSAYIHFLRKDIPIYCTEPTKIILQCIEETGKGTFSDLCTYCEAFVFYENRRGGLSRVDRRKEEYVTEREYNIMESKRKVRVKSLEIEMIPVDHSLPGACGFIVYSDEGNLVYSGDLRFHGLHGEKTHRFVEEAKNIEPDVFLCEGTRIDDDRKDSEEKVKGEIGDLISRSEGIAFAEHPKKDIDRAKTIYDSAKDNKREFVIDLKLAYLIEKLGKMSPLDIKDLKILIPKKKWGLIDKRVSKDQILKDYEKWERNFIFTDATIKCKELKNNPKDYVVSTSLWEMNQLIDIQPKNAIWIKSNCEPFSEDMELDEKRKQHWLEHFGIKEYPAHASGHASGPEIKQMIEEINAKKVIPIHTEHPEMF
jgi:ribonuclease J